MKKALKIMDKAFEVATIISIALMLLVVLIQVISRFAMPKAPSWTEEIARFFFVSGIAFAAPLAMRNKEFVRVDLVLNWLPKKVIFILDIIINLMIVAFVIKIAAPMLEFVKLGMMQRAATVNVPMAIPFTSIFIALIFVGFYCVLQIVNNFIKYRNGGER